MTEYAPPEVLVTTDWLADHLTDSQIRILEIDYDPSASYDPPAPSLYDSPPRYDQPPAYGAALRGRAQPPHPGDAAAPDRAGLEPFAPAMNGSCRLQASATQKRLSLLPGAL